VIYTPHAYQDHATEHIIDHPYSGLFLDMGLGKTVATLTAINRLMFDYFEISKVLVIAPKRVAEDTWTAERDKWDHLKHLRISKVLGTEKQRKEALKAKAEIYIINRENVVWLIGHLQGYWPFDMVVVDELSSFKSPKAQRFKHLRMVRPKMTRVVGLTGTPAPNSLMDLWPQIYLLDQGERLGKTITGYREKYFNPGAKNGHVVYEYKLKKVSDFEKDLVGDDYYEKKIYELIGDICISMKAEDYLDLPKRIDHVVEVTLPPKVMQQYKEFERKQVLTLFGNDEEISVPNAAALTNKLMQFANGAVYDENRNWHEVHKCKLEALEELIEAANGQPGLCFYTFIHDKERIHKHLSEYKPVNLKTPEDIKRWNEKKIPLMTMHPASGGHGLNLQAGGHYVYWFGPTYSLELYLQAVARVDRQGQIYPVQNFRLIAKGTIDEDVLEASNLKKDGQDALMDAVKAIVKKYKIQKAI
jgi:SNF2 family DNA or RNA helicase